MLITPYYCLLILIFCFKKEITIIARDTKKPIRPLSCPFIKRVKQYCIGNFQGLTSHGGWVVRAVALQSSKTAILFSPGLNPARDIYIIQKDILWIENKNCLWLNLLQISCFFKLFTAKNIEFDYFDQRLACAAPKRWSKYTTVGSEQALAELVQGILNSN